MLRFFNLQMIRSANCPESRFNVHRRTLLRNNRIRGRSLSVPSQRMGGPYLARFREMWDSTNVDR
jgi:hypothetical protein